MTKPSQDYINLRVRLDNLLSSDFWPKGCSSAVCQITGPAKGMHTNASCRCYARLRDHCKEMSQLAGMLSVYRPTEDPRPYLPGYKGDKAS